MPPALFAVRLASAAARCSIQIHGCCALGALRLRTVRQILAHDGTHEGGRSHGAKIEQTHLFGRQSHLCDAVVNDGAKFGMKLDLEGIGAHDITLTRIGENLARGEASEGGA